MAEIRLSIRISEEDKKLLKQAANREALSLSSWVRSKLLQLARKEAG